MQDGFTLLESIIIISIISILTAILATALPSVRTNQLLTSDTQIIMSVIDEARTRALNEDRSDECIQHTGEDDARLCSIIGISLQQQEMILFADINNDQQYNTTDFLLSSTSLNATSANQQVLVFDAVPPNITLFNNEQVVTPDAPATISLQLRNTTRIITVHPYGIVEVAYE